MKSARTWKAIALGMVAMWCALYAIRPAWALAPISAIGYKLTAQTASPCAANTACIYAKSTDANKLHYIDPSNSDIALGAGGGGSTGNWTFSGNIADLSGAGALQLGNGTATSVKLLPTTLTYATATSMTPAAQGATNTTGLSILGNVADGASSVGIVFEATTALPSGKVFRFNNGTGAEVFSLLSSFGSTVHELRAATGIFGFRNSTTTGVMAQTNTIFFYSGGTAYATIDSGGVLPNVDLGVPTGSSTKRWTQNWAQRYMGVSQSLAHSATPAFDCTAGELIHIGTVTASEAGTMVSGSPGEQCTISYLKDATAGVYALTFTGTNVRTTGTITMSVTASSVSTISFRWDDRLPTPAWVETGRANGQ